MKKKVLSMVLAATMVFSLAACGNEGKEGSSGAGTEQSSGQESMQGGADGNVQDGGDSKAASYKVTFYDSDGTTVLSEEEVADGASPTEYTPEKEGQVFMGWFATPSMGHVFDFSQPVTEDTSVFAGFMENKEDTRTFAILGSGKSPLLAVSSWGKVINDEHYMTKAEGENVYTITVDLCEGDEFQFAIDTSWCNQRGGGYLETTEADGVECFSVSGGLSDSTKKANIKCQRDGNYTFTLTTYPGADVYDTANSYYTEETKENYNSNPYDKITFTYNGEIQAQMSELTTAYYIKGAKVTEWQDKYDEQYRFTEENGIHTLVIDLEEGDEFLLTTLVTSADGTSAVGNEYVRYSNITDEESLAFVDGTESYNIVAKAAGTYTFTYDPATTQLTVGFEGK